LCLEKSCGSSIAQLASRRAAMPRKNKNAGKIAGVILQNSNRA